MCESGTLYIVYVLYELYAQIVFNYSILYAAKCKL